MLHETLLINQEIREEKEKEDINTLRKYGEQFIGRNLQDCIPELAKELYKISIYRDNITFKTYHSRRTKTPKWDIETNCCRMNTISISKDTILPEVFQTTIIKTGVDSCICKRNNKQIVTITIKFILDDSEEYVIEDRV